MVIEIELSKKAKKHKGYKTVVDDCDSEFAYFDWSVLIKETVFHVYAVRKDYASGKTVLLHRAILEKMLGYSIAKGVHIDHINGDGLDNRRENLRVATCSENIRNAKRHKDSTSGYKGVSFRSDIQKWRAYIYFDGRQITLGVFDDPYEAHLAYCVKAIELFGDFARFE